MKKPLYIIKSNDHVIGMFSNKTKAEAVYEQEWLKLKTSFYHWVIPVEKADPNKYHSAGTVGRVFESDKNTATRRWIKVETYDKEYKSGNKYTYETRKVWSRDSSVLTLDVGQFDDSEV
jgi:hypothetical protein